jgi:acyl-CoA thioesterase-1
LGVFLTLATLLVSPLHAEPLRLVVFGDSLSAGYGLPPGEDFVTKLYEKVTTTNQDIVIANAGVSGDTSTGGLARLDWSIPDGTDGVILELGANDMLRGIDPTVTAKAIDAMVSRLIERQIAVLMVGMQAAPNLGPAYVTQFNAIYPETAERYGVPLYPFFLDGVAANRALNQADGIHPNEAGVAVIVERIYPAVEAFIVSLRQSAS